MPDSRETKQHFETRRLGAQMEEAYEASSEVGTDEHVVNLRAENRGLLVMLLVILAVAAIVLSVFW